MGDFRKNILQIDFEGKNILQGNTWGKISCSAKNISHDVYWKKKSYTTIFPGKISGSKGLGRRFLPKPNHPSRPHPSKVEWLTPKSYRHIWRYFCLSDI